MINHHVVWLYTCKSGITLVIYSKHYCEFYVYTIHVAAMQLLSICNGNHSLPLSNEHTACVLSKESLTNKSILA